MTDAEAREILKRVEIAKPIKFEDYADMKEALDMAIKALEQQPCEDCISRAAVLDKKELVELEDGQSFYCINPKDIETLPSVTPRPKVGEWKYVTHYARRYRVCSECNAEKEDDRATGWDFCPHCGARMNGGGEE